MIKSELVSRIAAHNPHLYPRDIEHLVNAILGTIEAALCRGDPGGRATGMPSTRANASWASRRGLASHLLSIAGLEDGPGRRLFGAPVPGSSNGQAPNSQGDHRILPDIACSSRQQPITPSRAGENMTLSAEKALLACFAKAAGAGEMLNIQDLKAAQASGIRPATAPSTIF